METIQMIPVGMIFPHPNNPRKELGDLTELADSIRESGIFQNLTVIPGHRMTEEEWKQYSEAYKAKPCEELRDAMNRRYLDTGYTVVIGHRRLAASKLAGLAEVPCAVRDMDQKTQIATMLLENIQRNDLTYYEQAQGFQMMLDLGQTVEEISKATGFSRATVNRRLEMAKLDKSTLDVVSARNISLKDFEELTKIKKMDYRNQALAYIGTNDFNSKVRFFKSKEVADENRAMLKDWCKKATAIKGVDRWSGEYENICKIRIDDRPLTEEELVKLGEPEGAYYYIDDWEIAVYRKARKKPPVKRSPEELQREADIKAAWAELDRLNADAKAMRDEFAAGISVTKNNLERVAMALAWGEMYRSIRYEDTDRSTMLTLIPGYEDENWEGRQTMLKGLEVDRGSIMTVLRGLLGIDKSCCDGYRGSMPKHKRNVRLERWYDFLMDEGYQMAEWERELLDGSHEIYHRGESHGRL